MGLEGSHVGAHVAHELVVVLADVSGEAVHVRLHHSDHVHQQLRRHLVRARPRFLQQLRQRRTRLNTFAVTIPS